MCLVSCCFDSVGLLVGSGCLSSPLALRDHVGEGGGHLCGGGGSGGGLCAAGISSHDPHHSGQPGGVCAKEPGALAQEEGRMGKEHNNDDAQSHVPHTFLFSSFLKR